MEGKPVQSGLKRREYGGVKRHDYFIEFFPMGSRERTYLERDMRPMEESFQTEMRLQYICMLLGMSHYLGGNGQ